MVASYTQLLARRYKGKLDADADELIAFAVDGANRMHQLINDLLAFSRVRVQDAGLAEISSEAALARALLNLRGAIDDSGALVTHDALPRALADEPQLIQLFQNLIGNAIKYQGAGTPEVHVSSRGGAAPATAPDSMRHDRRRHRGRKKIAARVDPREAGLT